MSDEDLDENLAFWSKNESGQGPANAQWYADEKDRRSKQGFRRTAKLPSTIAQSMAAQASKWYMVTDSDVRVNRDEYTPQAQAQGQP